MAEIASGLSAQDTARRIRNAEGAPVTTRDWNSYPFIFSLEDKEKGYWEGRLILDVGSGNKWWDPEDVFPGARVCAVDPEFKKRIELNTAHETRRGIAQEIPYDDNHFDLVLSSHAVPQHILSRHRPLAISEMIRVMKPGGEIRLAPCVRGRGAISSEIENALAESGFEINFSERGSEGALVIIKASKDIKDSASLKDQAWQKFHGMAVKEQD